jgi:hypothetical protein
MAAGGQCTSSLAIGDAPAAVGYARESTMTIAPFLPENVFRPQDIQAMSVALEEVCNILNLADDSEGEREFLAKKIIALAHGGERSPHLLRDRILRELANGQAEWAAALGRAARHGAL